MVEDLVINHHHEHTFHCFVFSFLNQKVFALQESSAVHTRSMGKAVQYETDSCSVTSITDYPRTSGIGSCHRNSTNIYTVMHRMVMLAGLLAGWTGGDGGGGGDQVSPLLHGVHHLFQGFFPGDVMR
jgi:hypothetical protein